MNYETRIKEIAHFLHSITPIWKDEILHSYPHYKNHYPQNWIDDLDNLSDRELYLFDSRASYSQLSDAKLISFVQKIQELTKLPLQKTKEEGLPSWAFNQVKEKKKHEITILCNYIEELQEKTSFERVCDIGGGKGHLARVLAFYYGLDAVTIDQDLQLQELGKIRLSKYPAPEKSKNLQFINAQFGKEKPDLKNKIDDLFKGDVLTIGLHTCGPLAISHIQRSLEQKSKIILNFGCCYNKLNPALHMNLSKTAKSLAIDFSPHALTLASRGHHKMSWEDYNLKKKVKNFRYALHLLFYQKLNIKTFISVGEASAHSYKGEFSDYALQKLNDLNINYTGHSLSPENLNHFIKEKDIQHKIRRMFLCNIIRWQLGRVVELFILLDRALWLQENGHKVTLQEYFDPKLSPRNIGISAVIK